MKTEIGAIPNGQTLKKDLETFLLDRRSAMIKKWRDLIIGSYPADARRFLKKEKNRFANPVGRTIAEDVEILYDELVTGYDVDKISSSLDNLIRIRAVQDFRPSQAVNFVLQLRGLIRQEVLNAGRTDELQKGLDAFETRIDDMTRLAFDIYDECRRKIFEIRMNESKRQTERLLRLSKLTVEIPEQEPDSE